MILRQFPGHHLSAGEHERVYAAFGRENVLVCATSCDIAYTEHTAPLSIKTTLSGREVYEVERIPIAVEESNYLVLNNDQPYASYICSTTAVRSFCLFFRDGLDREVITSCQSSAERLLDDPEAQNTRPPPFFQNLRRRDALITPRLKRLHEEISAGLTSQTWLDEQFFRFMEILLRLDAKIASNLETWPAARQTTRIENFRRVCRARDFMQSCYDEPLTLKDLARVACLSQHHFLRLFKQAFARTPHQYLTDLRLQKARTLLSSKDLSVTDVYTRVGFENASSFARLFKQRFGVAPSRWRRERS